jgi:cobalt-zinc-cadmium resistance protein CzcA
MNFNKLIKYVLKNKKIVLILSVIMMLTGLFCLKTLDIEAYPDFTSPMVQVITEMSGKSAEDVERLATIPLEKELNGIPHEKMLYSNSLFGLSVIKVVFDDNMSSNLIRQQVLERISQADLPEDIKPQLGPDASPIGEIFRYTLESDFYNPMTLKALEDWDMERAFKQVKGVINVNSFGGPVKTYKVILNHEKIRFYNLDVREVYDAIKQSNSTAGGHYIDNNNQAFIVRGIGLFTDIESLKNTVISSQKGTPIRIKDVGEVVIEPAVRLGQVGKNFNDDTVEGIVLMRKSENPSKTIKNLKRSLPDIISELPKGVKLVPIYDRSTLINNTMKTISHNVILGIFFVVVILYAFIKNLRLTLITSLTIPLALSFAFILFKIFSIPANLLSMGAVDFGILVDAAVILAENIYTKISGYKNNLTECRKKVLVYKAVKEMWQPIFFSTLIILCCFLPIFAFNGVAGKLFHPLAFTMGFSLIGAVITSLFIIPVLVSKFLHSVKIKEQPEIFGKFYEKLLDKTLKSPKKFFIILGGILISSFILLPFIGSEFLPNLDEGNIWLRVTVIPRSTTINHSVEVARQIRETLLKYPEVTNVISHIGSADDGEDPNLLSNIENMVDLKLSKKWRFKFHKNKQKLINDMERSLNEIPGITTYFTQYIQDNVEEAVSGSKGQVVLKIYGHDLYNLQKLQDEAVELLGKVRGIVDISYDQIIGQPQYQIKADRTKAARYGLKSDDIQKVIEIAIGGKNATQIIKNEKRFNVFLRLEQEDRNSLEKLENIIVKTPDGISVPLSNVANITNDNGAMIITRSENQRVAIIRFNIRNRDLGSTVNEAEKLLKKELKLPDNYRIKWAGQSESQKSANIRLGIILPLTILLISAILFIHYKKKRYVGIALCTILPVLSGAIFILFLTKTYFSISAGVGLIAAIGVSIQNSVIILSSLIKTNTLGDEELKSLACKRLRPVLSASLVAILGLMPAALSNGIGAQSQKPFAITIIGGLTFGTVITIFLVPLLYKLTKEKKCEI